MQAHNYLAMTKKEKERLAQLKVSKQFGSTCMITCGLYDKVEQMRKIYNLRTKLHRDCVNLQLEDNKQRSEKSKQDVRES